MPCYTGMQFPIKVKNSLIITKSLAKVYKRHLVTKIVLTPT